MFPLSTLFSLMLSVDFRFFSYLSFLWVSFFGPSVASVVISPIVSAVSISCHHTPGTLPCVDSWYPLECWILRLVHATSEKEKAR